MARSGRACLVCPGQLSYLYRRERVGRDLRLPFSVGEGLRIANHASGAPTTPETIDRTIHPIELDEVLPFARTCLRGTTNPVRDSAVCMDTTTTDHHFIVDRHPAEPQIIIGAGFSGHGFQLAPVIGEMLASLALDEQATPLPLFALTRFPGLR